MKISLELLRVEQIFVPDTGEQANLLILELGGQEVAIEVSQEAMEAAVAQSVVGLQEAPQGYEEQPLPPEEPPQEAFMPSPSIAAVVQPTFAQVEEWPVEKSAVDQRLENIESGRSRPKNGTKDALEEMKSRARSTPMRTVPSDEMGYPVVPQRAGGAPEISDRAIETSLGSDHDGFGQG